ncbi:MAG: hypothetical protein WD232_11045 [Acidimicrobiales bacterium]
MPTASPEVPAVTPAARRQPLGPVLTAVFSGTAAWCALGAGVPATFGAHVAVDEPQYLLSATSLAEDLDLDIGDELADERWRSYHRAELPEQTELLEDGRRISPHDPLLPAYLALPVAVGGWVGAKLALAVVAGALAAVLTWTAVRRLGVGVGLAVTTVLTFSLAPPLAVYGTQIYPELAGALAISIGFAAATGRLCRRDVAVAGVAISALPWLSVKYAPAAGALTIALLWRLWTLGHRRQLVALLGGLTISAAVFAVGHLAIYGALTPYATGDHFGGDQLAVAGTAPNPAGRSRRLIGLLVDRDFGLVAWQPSWLLGVVGLGTLARRRPTWWPAVALPLAAGWLTATFVALTMHGFWWPGRQTVVVLPLLVLTVAWAAGELGRLAPTLLKVGLAWGALTFGWLVADGTAGRTTWVVAFEESTNPLVRTIRQALPDLRSLGTVDQALFLAWIVVVVALVVIGWGGARGRSHRQPGSDGTALLSPPAPTHDPGRDTT